MTDLQTFIESYFSRQVTAHVTIPQREGCLNPFPVDIDERIVKTLAGRGIDGLYSHQVEAFNSIRSGHDTLLVSRTASGKTLSFFIPIVQSYLEEKAPFSVLFLYPTKALSRDQESVMGGLLALLEKRCAVGTFDGDTPREEREMLQKRGDFIISNPDMLHGGILPNHSRKWKSFISRLRYVVVDEVHMYRGSFGSHVANVMRRLLRVCEMHGSRPVFIGASATVGNPGELAASLFHRNFTVIDRDGSPGGERHLYIINPSMVKGQGDALYRKGPGSVSVPLLRHALQKQIRTICFARGRQEVERIYTSVVDGNGYLERKIRPYRGGLLPSERRGMERDLAAGSITAVITTNALELGIDIGDLDLCIISGYPGTIASFWQQSGRVGRRGRPSVTVFIARETSIDQYLVHHPGFITSAPLERAYVNGDNPYIFLQHLPCAAHEHPLREQEPLFDSTLYGESRDILLRRGTLVPWRENLRYSSPDYPARGVNLRGLTDYNIEIHDGTEVIGEIDPIGAMGTLYRDAIYQHLGRRYMSLDLDLEKKLCSVTPVEVDYFTEAVWEGRIDTGEILSEKNENGASVHLAFMTINRQPRLYKKIRERTFENIGYGPITLPAFTYDTTGFALQPPRAWIKAMESEDPRIIDTALYGLSWCIRRMSPLMTMAEPSDVGTDVAPARAGDGRWKSALYLYDAVDGGVGYAEKIYESLLPVLGLCLSLVRECECKRGCPSCVPPLPPGIREEGMAFVMENDAALRSTESLLVAMLEEKIIIPVVTSDAVADMGKDDQGVYQADRMAMRARLNRAADIMQVKRERLH